MSTITVSGASLGNSLTDLLQAQDIQPGDAPSYAVCKAIYAYHPLGAKIADNPIKMAQSQPRRITIGKGPEEDLRQAFETEWKAISAHRHIFNAARLSRVYGVASIAMVSTATPADRPVDFKQLAQAEISFNVLDPLNTAGSLVLSQNPNAPDFQKVAGVSVAGQAYHRSRTVTVLNEDPVYIEYTASAFGYVGRSVYQRALFPLKSFLNTLITDDMISIKAGLLVAMIKTISSAIDGFMASVAGVKRSLLKEATVGQVLQIGHEDKVESLDLKNLAEPYSAARKHILENIASAAGTPAQVINSETFAEGFGEGAEDAKKVAQYIDAVREWMEPLYDYFDKIVMYRAWNPEFYKTIQAKYPDQYGSVGYTQAFYDWRNSFKAIWPNLLEEPDSEKVKVEDTKAKAVIALIEALVPECDPDNKATLIEWACDQISNNKLLFTAPLLLDIDALRDYVPATPVVEPAAPEPYSESDTGAPDMSLAA